MRITGLFAAALFAIHSGIPQEVLAGDQFKLLNLQVGDKQVTGRVLAHNDDGCWLLERDGRLQAFAMDKVSRFSEAREPFKAQSQTEFKNQLQAEFGKNFEVRTSHHYVVVARRGAAETYATLFEQIYREFVRLFRARGLEISEPEFPLVAIVFPDQLRFVSYCASEGTRISPGLVGFYLPSSNRVAMYERTSASDIDDTVIHEATHQVAFNTGVHSRVATNPRWLVEGLATVCEADGIRSRQSSSTPADRVNRGRFLWFQEFAGNRRSSGSLRNFLRDDQSFEKATLDAYSEAWALSFFLLETRPLQYSKYLKRLANRDPLKPYESDSRVKDFTDIFGEDLEKLETGYLQFIKRLGDSKSAAR